MGRERPLREGARGLPGSLAGKTPGKERSRRLAQTRPLPGPCLSLPCFLTPLFYPFRSSGRFSTASISLALRPLLSPSPITSDPGPAPGRGSGRVSHLPAPRLPLPEVFPHRRVPARPRGAPLHHRRLRGRHAVRAV